MRTDYSTKRCNQMQAPNATIKRKHQTPPLVLALCACVLCLSLVLEFYACVLCLRFVLAFCGSRTFTILQKLYLPSILHLTLTRFNSLTINTLLSVRCYQSHLHASYTTHTLPHGTSTGGIHHGIGGQESLSLRQISLRPYAVLSTAHDKTDCAAVGCGV